MTSRGAFYPQLLWLCDSAMQDECRLIVVYFFSPIVLHYLPNISKHCVQLLSSEMTLQSYLLLRSFLGDNSSLGDHHMMYNIKNLHPQPLTCLFVALCTLKIICSLIVCSHNIVISCRYFVGGIIIIIIFNYPEQRHCQKSPISVFIWLFQILSFQQVASLEESCSCHLMQHLLRAFGKVCTEQFMEIQIQYIR